MLIIIYGQIRAEEQSFFYPALAQNRPAHSGLVPILFFNKAPAPHKMGPIPYRPCTPESNCLLYNLPIHGSNGWIKLPIVQSQLHYLEQIQSCHNIQSLVSEAAINKIKTNIEVK